MGPLKGEMDAQWAAKARVSRQSRYLFTRNLSLLLNAGCPLMKSLEVLAEQADSPVMAEVVWTLRTDVSSGKYLSKSCSRFPAIFSPTYVGVLKISEETGRLVMVLARMADWLDKDSKVIGKLKAAASYPCLVCAVTLFLSFWMCYFVLPGILESVTAAGGPIPLPTRILMGLVSLLRAPTSLALGCLLLVGSAASGYQLWQSASDDLRYRCWELALALPLLGPLVRDSSLIRYCASAEILICSGTDLLKTLRMAALTSGNPVLLADFSRVKRVIEDNGNVASALASKPQLYGTLLPHLVGAFEEVGVLEKAYVKASSYLEESVDERLTAIQNLLEPLLLSGMAFLVLFFLLSVMLPLYAQISSGM